MTIIRKINFKNSNEDYSNLNKLMNDLPPFFNSCEISETIDNICDYNDKMFININTNKSINNCISFDNFLTNQTNDNLFDNSDQIFLNFDKINDKNDSNDSFKINNKFKTNNIFFGEIKSIIDSDQIYHQNDSNFDSGILIGNIFKNDENIKSNNQINSINFDNNNSTIGIADTKDKYIDTFDNADDKIELSIIDLLSITNDKQFDKLMEIMENDTTNEISEDSVDSILNETLNNFSTNEKSEKQSHNILIDLNDELIKDTNQYSSVIPIEEINPFEEFLNLNNEFFSESHKSSDRTNVTYTFSNEEENNSENYQFCQINNTFENLPQNEPLSNDDNLDKSKMNIIVGLPEVDLELFENIGEKNKINYQISEYENNFDYEFFKDLLYEYENNEINFDEIIGQKIDERQKLIEFNEIEHLSKYKHRRYLLHDKIVTSPKLSNHKFEKTKIIKRTTIPRPANQQTPQLTFKCTYENCNKTYAKATHLKSHLRRHNGERPFICTWPKCEWRFSRSDELTRHRRSHSGIKPYKCTICVKAFARSDHLKKHMRVHEKRMAQYGMPFTPSQLKHMTGMDFIRTNWKLKS